MMLNSVVISFGNAECQHAGRAYFSFLLRAVPAGSALFEKYVLFSTKTSRHMPLGRGGGGGVEGCTFLNAINLEN